jgi:type IV pilus assembly protein PilA
VMSRRRRRYTQGTTLVELMIVVVILGILAALAGVGYKRYVARARLAEAHGMLAELSAKEQLYFMEFGMYIPARLDNNLALPSPDEAKTAFIPTDPSAANFESARTAHAIGAMPTAWSLIGLKPQWPALYCSYLVNAGGSNQAPPASAKIGIQLWSATPPVPWFYAVAVCNLNTSDDGSTPSDLPTNATYLVLTNDSPSIRVLNDGH